MRILTTILASTFLMTSSVVFAEPTSFKATVESGTSALGSWTAGDHMGAAARYEEEARLLQAEARGIEQVENQILPYLEVEAIEQAGVGIRIDRRLKEAEEYMKLANWHHEEGMRLFAAKEASMPAAGPSQKSVTTGVSQTSNSPAKKPYLKFDWIEEETLSGW